MTKRTALSIMALSMLTCACSNTTASNTNSYAGSSVVGEVTALSLDSISITPGTVSEVEMDDFMNNMPADMQQPDANNEGQDQGDDASTSESQDSQVPDKPDGDSQENGDMGGQTPPDMPNGQQGEMQQPENKDASDNSQEDMQKPDDASGEDQNADQASMAQPGGDMQGGDMPQGGMGFGDMSMYSFTADENTSTLTFDLSDAQYAYADSDMNEDIDLRYLYIGAVVEIEVDEDGNASKISLYSNIVSDDQMQMGDSNVNQGTSANTIDEDATIENESYSSDGDDENALRITDATVSLDSITVDKNGGSSSNTEDGDFYGMNAALLATNGAM